MKTAGICKQKKGRQENFKVKIIPDGSSSVHSFSRYKWQSNFYAGLKTL